MVVRLGNCLTVLLGGTALVLLMVFLFVYFGYLAPTWAEASGGDRRDSGTGVRGTFWFEFGPEDRAAHPVATWLLGPVQHYLALWLPALVVGGGGIVWLASWLRDRRRRTQPPPA